MQREIVILARRLVALMAAVALLFVGRVWAQPVLGQAAGSVERVGQPQAHGGHGWAVVPEPRGSGFLVVYLPPREFAAPGGGVAGAEAGTVRVAVRLTEAPEAIAAVGEDVYLVFRPTANGRGAMQRMVYSLTAVQAGLDEWSYMPTDRLRAEDALAGEGELVGLAGTPVGPAALIDRGPRESGAGMEVEGGEAGRAMPRPPPELSLSVLSGGLWREVGLPAEAMAGGGVVGLEVEGEAAGGSERILRRFKLATSAEGIALLATRPARRAMVWSAALTTQAVRAPEAERETVRREREEAARASDRERRVGDEERAGRGSSAEAERDEEELPLAPIEVEWSARAMALPSGGERSMVLPTGPIAVMGSGLVFAHQEGEGGVAVYVAGGGGGQRIFGLSRERMRVGRGAPGDTGGEGKPAAVIGVVNWVESGRVGLVLAPAGVVGERGGSILDLAINVRVVELSADTGAVVFDGPSTTGGAMGREQFQAFVLVVLGVTTILLVWTIKGGGAERAIRLPEGSALGEPGRRLIAGGIDFLVTCCVTGWIVGVPLGEAVTLQMVLGPGATLGGLATLLGVGVGLNGLMEGLLGRSLGKLAMGLRVVAVVGRRAGSWRGPGVWRGLSRCAFKWTAAPLAILGLSRADARHFGDVLSGTGVVVRVDGEAEEESEQSGVE